ncbi:hypothetical protein PSCICO_24590 [Pseudomonas cichorii]|uniref:DUF5625 family protein n=1 Tax=Pseudomonas cichorii TaxID=36746 RepID=UPI001910D87B|nr:DUF5625 family protein [Pseudomonas cichorii]GFM87060.1 hypothetical protein PSCICO_24590 [Pseudomonas cichorii]
MSFLKSFLVLLLCGFLTGCSEKVWIIKPFDVSLPNQYSAAKFRVSESGGYRVALLFVWGESELDVVRQRKLWGRFGLEEKGTLVPVRLRVTKNNELFFDEVLLAGGVDSGHAFEYGGVHKSALAREVKSFALSPGNYSFEIFTMDGVEAFRGDESYVIFSYYGPKV